VLSQTVFDSILWVQDGLTNKVSRRVPSALDVAFAALGNDQIVPELVTRMKNAAAAQSPIHAERWRDGWNYQHNLAAVRAVLDSQEESAWDSNLYLGWLAALRELSAPTTDPAYPEAMRTQAWARKTLNTQLASWTQLRHDTILYAKQSYTSIPVCFYPAGFVEPRVAFWRRLERTIRDAAQAVSALSFPAAVPSTWNHAFDRIQTNQVEHLRGFADVVGRLGAMAAKELAQQPFSEEEELLIRNWMQDVGFDPVGSGGSPKYSGWYPTLFYRPLVYSELTPRNDFQIPQLIFFHETDGAAAKDIIVADVHTDLPAPLIGDPGSVLHEGIGVPNLLLLAVDNGADRMMYAGPVLSHYEADVIGPPLRLTDNLWEQYHSGVTSPQPIEGLTPPPWTQGYLVPR
jgi:hypothetical protein